MSLETWKQEFYPASASQSDKKDAVKHSLRKWEGLLPANLEKHGVSLESCSVYEEGEPYLEGFDFDADNCSLCYHFKKNACSDCPLKLLFGEPCYEASRPFAMLADRSNPLPMIDALRELAKEEVKP